MTHVTEVICIVALIAITAFAACVGFTHGDGE